MNQEVSVKQSNNKQDFQNNETFPSKYSCDETQKVTKLFEIFIRIDKRLHNKQSNEDYYKRNTNHSSKA